MRSVWVLLGLVGCGGGEDSDADRGTASQIWCRGLCEAQSDCGAPSASFCVNDCVTTRPGLANFSEDGARALRPCLANLSCEELSSEPSWDAAMDACWERARSTVDVASYARSFCTLYVEAWFECGAYWSVGECERAYSMWNERVIARLEPCLRSVSCDALRACDETTWSSL
jgi:hypothetical protein